MVFKDLFGFREKIDWQYAVKEGMGAELAFTLGTCFGATTFSVIIKFNKYLWR